MPKTLIYLPNYNAAVIDELRKRFIFSTNDAWCWLGYEETSIDNSSKKTWPAEVLGALPVINYTEPFITS